MSRRLLIGALVTALVVGVGAGGWWWFVSEPARRLDAVVLAVAASFESGIADPAVFDAAAGEQLKRIYAGMGDLRPTVGASAPRRPEPGRAEVEFTWRWEIHAGKTPWEYRTTVGLRDEGGTWRAVWAPSAVYAGLQEGEALRATRLAPVRGAIVGQGGKALAWNQPALRVGIDKTLADAPTAEASAATLAQQLGLDASRYVERVRAAGPKAFVEARVLRALDPAEAELARTAQRGVAVRVLETTRPLGLTSTFARPLLGVVGEATAEQVAESGGRIRGGDLTGRGGLQEARDHVLAGTTGFVVSVVDAAGATREAFRVDKLDGSDVVTSIDVPLQQAAERLLAGVGPASAIVAIRPSDGAVLVAASGPGSQGLSTATLGQYAPGSTFKTVTTLAMLRAGVRPDATVPCTDGIAVDGYRFDNYAGYPASALGDVSLPTAFAQSCNSAFIAQADAVSQADLVAAADGLGLTAEPSLVVGAFSGRVPVEATKVEHAASMIGQGKVVASPLGMATVAAAIAHGGPVRPWLVNEPARPQPQAATPLTAAEADTLRQLMRGVVTGGSGGALRDVPGEPVLAKTGTASHGPTNPPRYHGWMIAIQGDLAVAAFVEDATSGSADAGPLVKGLLLAARG